jgi:hypothetical protein
MRLKPDSAVSMKAFQPIIVLFVSWSMILAGVRDGFAYQTDPFSRHRLRGRVPSNYSNSSRPSPCTLMR